MKDTIMLIRTRVSPTNMYVSSPQGAEFAIDLDTATTICGLQCLVTEHGLCKVERLDNRTRYFSPGEPGERDEEFPSECDTLCVDPTSFWFEGYIKHTDTKIKSWPVLIADLVKHFELPLGNNTTSAGVERTDVGRGSR